MIYKLKSDVENYKWIEYPDIAPFEQQWGKRMKPSWKPLKLRYIPDRKAKTGDCPHFTAGFPVISEAALTILNSIIHDDVELLDIEIKNENRRFYLVNVTNILDCLDYDNSVIKRFDNGKIICIPVHAFFEEKTTEAAVFRLPDHESEVFATERFVEAVENSSLEGFSFQETPEEDENPFAVLLRPKKRRGKNIWR